MSGQMGLRLGLGRMGSSHAAQSSEWAPRDLGEKLHEWWDAERSASFSLSGTNVTIWYGRKQGTILTQAVSGFKPVLTPTGFNGRPGVSFDGVDDVLISAGVPNIPTGNTPSEMWVALDQLNPAGVGTAFPVFVTMNGSSQGTSRNIAARDRSGVKRVDSGPPAASPVFDPVTDFVGRFVVRAQHKVDATVIATNQGPEYSVANVLDRTGTRVTMGGGAAAVGPSKIILNSFFITAPLTTDERDLLWTFLRTRAGV